MLKPDISPKTVIQAIPPDCFEKPLSQSIGYLLRDAILFAGLSAAILFVDNWLVGTILALLLGTVLTGIFVLGHDCGHRSFARSVTVNNLVGEFTTAMALWPFHVWRLSHDIHHRYTNNIERDVAWVPFTREKYHRISPVARAIYRYTRTSLYFIGSMFFSYYFVKDGLRGSKSRHFRREDMPEIRRSILITATVGSAYGFLAYYSGGWYGLCLIFLVPQVVFHFWLSTFTLFHHTHPDNRFLAESEWTFARGQLDSTIHVSYLRPIEWLTHDINWHVPHHVCVGVPHYHLRCAHRALKQRFGDRVREVCFDLKLVRSVIDQCHLVESKKVGELDWQQVDRPFVPAVIAES